MNQTSPGRSKRKLEVLGGVMSRKLVGAVLLHAVQGLSPSLFQAIAVRNVPRCIRGRQRGATDEDAAYQDQGDARLYPRLLQHGKLLLTRIFQMSTQRKGNRECLTLFLCCIGETGRQLIEPYRN